MENYQKIDNSKITFENFLYLFTNNALYYLEWVDDKYYQYVPLTKLESDNIFNSIELYTKNYVYKFIYTVDNKLSLTNNYYQNKEEAKKDLEKHHKKEVQIMGKFIEEQRNHN